MIRTSLNDGIAVLTIDMPERAMNVFTREFIDALDAAVGEAAKDDAVKGIVITSGKPSFSAGADLGLMRKFAAPGVSPADAMEMIAGYGEVFRRIEKCGKPVVAAATGTALGAGLELMLACHYRIAADQPSARFGLPEVKVGLLPGAGGTQRLPRLVGIAASLPLLTQGSELSAAAALEAGILHEVVPADQLLASARRVLLEGKLKPIAPWDEKGYRLPGGDAYTLANQTVFTMTNASVHAATRGHYPAPREILRCVHEGSRLPIDKALRLEQKLFARLVQGEVAQGMIRTLFFARQGADKLVRRPAGVPASKVKRLGILGSGFMGAGIAQASALAGIDVVLIDREQAIADRSRDGILESLDADVQKGRLSAERRDASGVRLFTSARYEAFADCDMVIEAVVEDFGVKEIVTRAAESVMRSDAIFASNTSALPINELAQVSRRPANFIGLHFFSPVPKMALVEVIVGRDTAPETLARSLDYVRQIRKTPIIVNDGYGFYTTRCVDAYVREGIRLLLDGVDPVLIENAGTALGMPVGPLSLGDEVGLDVLHHICHFFRAREDGAWADDRHERVDMLMDALISKRRFGRKTAAGFYAYPADAPKHLDHGYLEACAQRAAAQPTVAQVEERLLYAQLVEAARCWAEGVTTDPGETDLGAVLGWSFPAWLGGPAAAIDRIGAGEFVVRCDALAKELGARFSPPQRLRTAAVPGFRFHA